MHERLFSTWRSLLFPAVACLLLAGCGGGGGGSDDDDDDDGGGLPATASAARGALLYDAWWDVTGSQEPTSLHPAYPVPPGTQTGSRTWRCSECHGWDYEGAQGAYGSGSHYTGIVGVLGSAAKPPQDLFVAIQGTGTTHDFAPYLTDADVWDLVAFVEQGAQDTGPFIGPTGLSLGTASAGQPLYTTHCAGCHGADGTSLDLGSGKGVGDLALSDPWEVLHKIRWGTPDDDMPGLVEAGLTATQISHVLAYAQTLNDVAPPPPPPPPATVSYATTIHPIWAGRSCTGCHGSSGGLTLSGNAGATYAELFEKAGRVDTTTPSNSTILKKPLGLSHGGGAIFSGTSDADYQKILTWISQGALNN